MRERLLDALNINMIQRVLDALNINMRQRVLDALYTKWSFLNITVNQHQNTFYIMNVSIHTVIQV